MKFLLEVINVLAAQVVGAWVISASILFVQPVFRWDPGDRGWRTAFAKTMLLYFFELKPIYPYAWTTHVGISLWTDTVATPIWLTWLIWLVDLAAYLYLRDKGGDDDRWRRRRRRVAEKIQRIGSRLVPVPVPS